MDQSSLWERFEKVLEQESVIYDDIKDSDYFKDLFRDVNEDEPETTQEDLIWEFIRDRREGFSADFFDAEFDDGKLLIYRCVAVEKINAYLKAARKGKLPAGVKGMGVFWTWDLASAECHWGYGQGTELILVGLVDASSIDVKRTVLANFQPNQGEDEKEITLKDDAPVWIESILLRRGVEPDPMSRMLHRFQPPALFRA